MALPLLVELSAPMTFLANVVAWATFHIATGLAAHRLRLDRLARDGWLLRPRAVEHGGRIYERLRIRRWKNRLPEAGALFEGGVSKRRLTGEIGRSQLDRFVVETRRAELAHWWAMACGPLAALWNPLVGLLVMVGYGVVVNAPFIAIQRYNRQRAQRVLAARRSSRWA